MVVLQHESLHQTLWGPAAPNGRSRRTDVAVYLQLASGSALSIVVVVLGNARLAD